MRIAYLAAGAGNMYCGSCLHGNTLAAALRALGHDCLLAPLYTPIRTDEDSVSIERVSFGGINVYLQQHSAVFRHTPWFVDRWFDRPDLIRWATRRSAAVRPEHLGALTVSMLEGEHGRQRKELQKLVRWLSRDVRPEVVHLNNAILLGMAPAIRQRLRVPVVCSLTGEDIFLDKLVEPYYTLARETLRRRAAEVTLFVAMNAYYADHMAEYLRVPRDRIRVVRPGLNLAGHGTRQSRGASPTIGFLARICPDKGLHQLVAAFRILARDRDVPAVRLRVAGYLDRADAPYLAGIEREIALAGVSDRVEFLGELDRAAKIAFLQSLDVFCLPTVYRESKGLSLIEAWANAVPAVLPAHGAFPEMIQDTGGGVLCEPNDPAALAAGLKHLLTHAELAAECGRNAQRAVRQWYNSDAMGQQTVDIYRSIVSPVSAVP